MSDPSDNQVTFSLVKSRHNENYIPVINGAVFESNRSTVLFDNAYSELLKKKNNFFIFIGTDSGLLIKYVLEHLVPGSVYIFVDFPEVTDFLKKNNLIQELPENVFISDPDGWSEIATEQGFQNYLFMNATIVLQSYASVDANLEEYLALTRRIEDEYYMLKFRADVNFGRREYVKVQLADVCENVLPAIHLKKSFLGKTAIILGGGPSVVDSFPWVKENREKLLLIAVSRIARVLKNAEITPDIFISLDPYQENLATSEGLLDFSDVLLVNGHHLEPRLLSQWEGRSMYLGTRFPWKTDLNDLGNIGLPGPTVANSAIHLATEMGCHHIYLSGIDLCFSSEGFTHVKGTQEHTVGPKVGFTGRRVQTYQGDYAVTIPAFDMARSTFEEQAVVAKNVGIRLYNLNKNAALIPGIDYADYESIVLPEDTLPALKILDDIYLEKNIDDQYLLNDVDEVLEELKAAKKDFHAMKKLCDQALIHNHKMYERYDIKNFRKHKKKLDDIEERLETQFGHKSLVVQNFGFASFVKFVRPETYDWSPEEMEEVGKIYYDAYLSTLNDMVSLIDSSIERTLCRKEEHLENPNFEKMFAQWRKDMQPGRGKVWTKYHAEQLATLAPEIQTEFSNLEADYQSLMDETRKWWADTLTKGRDVVDVREKMWNLFRRGDIEQLYVLRNALLSKSDEYVTNEMIDGLIAELEKNIELAYENYCHVVEGSKDFMFVQRKAYCELYLQKYEDALSSMKVLGEEIPYFKTRYAELLKGLGKTQECIDQYTEYLQHSPDDYTSFIRLGEIYKELGISEGVEWIAQYVLSKEPENEAAKQLRDSG